MHPPPSMPTRLGEELPPLIGVLAHALPPRLGLHLLHLLLLLHRLRDSAAARARTTIQGGSGGHLLRWAGRRGSSTGNAQPLLLQPVLLEALSARCDIFSNCLSRSARLASLAAFPPVWFFMVVLIKSMQ